MALRRHSKPGCSLAIRCSRDGAIGVHDEAFSPAEWTMRRVTVMGLGRHGGGVGAARYLARRGARVTVSDSADPQSLAESIEQLRDVPLAEVKLGGHDPADFRQAEFVVVNPAVRFDHPALQIARNSGAVLTSEIELFLRACPATVIGVTGSNGKSTTCSMLAAILTAAGGRTWIGGNFGGSLLEDIEQMTAQDWVVLELSSFQIAHLSDSAPLPRFALVTNCTPNHLDWHGDFGHYVRSKQRLVVGASPRSVVVVNEHDPQVRSWRSLAPGRMRSAWALERIPSLSVPGAHNRQNAACAAAVAEAAGIGDAVICGALASYEGLDHRLQFVAELDGRRFYNDSKSTTPEATLAALDAIDGPVWLLAGGHPKAATFDELARAVVKRARGAALYGAAREALRKSLQSQAADFDAHATEHLADALDWCWRSSRRGESILLSPACASYDQFRDFAARGEMFCRLVHAF
jgi:UDP-N-acetylmuramoylalanine--D-glutamate ligase